MIIALFYSHIFGNGWLQLLHLSINNLPICYKLVRTRGTNTHVLFLRSQLRCLLLGLTWAGFKMMTVMEIAKWLVWEFGGIFWGMMHGRKMSESSSNSSETESSQFPRNNRRIDVIIKLIPPKFCVHQSFAEKFILGRDCVYLPLHGLGIHNLFRYDHK